jgi:hypothetical protein
MSRTAKALAGVALIAVAVSIATGWIWSSTATATEAVGERIDVVEIDNDSGNVSITAGDVDRTQVKQKFSYRFDSPGNAFEVDDGVLKLKDCGWWCSVDYEVVVPAGTEVSGELDSGNLLLAGVASADVKADSGNITLRDIAGDLTLDIDSGNVEGTGLGGDLTANVDSGRLDLQFDEQVDVTADVDSGDIELTVPDGEYRVEGESDSGSRDIQVDKSQDAEYVLELNVDSGNLAVRNG